MARINASEVIRQIIRGLGLSTSRDKIPMEVTDKVLPVYVANPEPEIILKEGVLSDGTTVTVHTCSLTKRTFLTFAHITVAKSALSNAVKSDVFATSKGKGIVGLLPVRYEPSTAGAFSDTATFVPPIELEKGSTIRLVHNSGTASIDGSLCIGLFEVDDLERG